MFIGIRQPRCGDRAPLHSMGWLVLALGLLATPSVLAQPDSALTGTVTTRDGKPIATLSVYGSVITCCPPKREAATTNQEGQFRLEHPGAVIHFFKDGLQPRAYVIGPGTSAVHIILEDSPDTLVVPVCEKVGAGEQRIGWGNHGIQFNVVKRVVRILGGRPDVDYVEYVIKRRTGEGHLELWFGPYAMSEQPEDDQFINSEGFTQRNVVASDGRLLGVDSRGQQRVGGSWRQTQILGGGSRYRGVSPEDASLFDQIVNSVCEIPYPSQR